MQKIELKGAFLVLTNKCNLSCKYCYQDSSPYIKTKNELRKKEWINLIKELKKLKAKKLSFVGGEPLIYKDFWGVLDYAYKKGFKIKIFTNGILLDCKKIKKLKKYNSSLSFNLNSHNSKIQDFYQGKGNWKKTIKTIKNVKNQKLRFEIASPITKKNFQNIDKFIDFCIKLGAKRIRFVPLVLIGKAVKLKKDRPSKRQIQDLKNKIKKYKQIEITIGCRNCEGGINYLTIQSNGDVTPCSINRNITIGNIKKNSIKDILKRMRKSKSRILYVCSY